jgi:glycosyltransferase involved in cell wall biosynthesis
LYDSLNTNNKQKVDSSYFKFHETIRKINFYVKTHHINSIIFNGGRAIYLIPFIKHENKIAYRHSTFRFVTNLFKKLIMIFSSILSFCFAQRIVLLFENAKNEIKVFRNKITIINNGIDVCSYSKKDYSIIQEKLKIAIIARLHKDKGQLIAIDAIKEINSPIELWLIGGGADYQNIENYIQTNNLHFVKLLGFRDDIKLLLQQVDILILPSKYEAFPFSLLEGMASGLPLIATNTGGNSEIIQNNYNGFLIDYNDKTQLQVAIDKFINDPTLLKKMGNNSLDLAKEKFDIKIMIDKIFSL